MRHLLALIACFGLLGCPVWVDPVAPDPPSPLPPLPPPPPEPPLPPLPPEPTPIDPEPTVRAHYSQVRLVVPDMPRDALHALLGPPAMSVRQDDGSTIERWYAENEAGEPRWLVVQLIEWVVYRRSLWR